jgi:hypothetical protein
MMRKLIVILAVVVVLVVAVLVGNQIAVHHTESTIASRIEQRVPGARASVTIPSSGFLLHLASSGTIQDIHAHVTGVTDGELHFNSVDIAVQDLKVSRSDLVHGSVHLISLARATITGSLSVADVLQANGLGSLAALGGLVSGLTASVTAGSGRVQIAFGPLTFSVPYNSLIPCVGSAHVSGGQILLTCTTTTIPPVLQTT